MAIAYGNGKYHSVVIINDHSEPIDNIRIASIQINFDKSRTFFSFEASYSGTRIYTYELDLVLYSNFNTGSTKLTCLMDI